MKIETIDHRSSFLSDVIALGSKNSSTLGFLPVGGFEEHARKRCIIIAHKGGVLLGYLLYRTVSKNRRISIVHLCINPEYRGKAIATQLIEELKTKYMHSFSGIMLSCRKDYVEANKLWRKFGFISKNEVRSRSAEERYLIKWWYDFNARDLFSEIELNPQKTRVLLDANIIIKLRDNNKPEHDEVKALLADWLIDEVDYYYAQEFFNEIYRDNNRDRAEKTRSYIHGNFIGARFNMDESHQINERLLSILPGQNENDSSDRKQLSQCIASGIEYFVTSDNTIHGKRNEIQNEFNISIFNPLEFILEVDKLKKSTNYYPARLAGAKQSVSNVDAKTLKVLVNKFVSHSQGESKVQFSNRINQIVQNITDGSIKTVKCPTDGELAFWGYHLSPKSLEIPFIRVVGDDHISHTLFVQLLAESIKIAILKGKNTIKVSDLHILHTHFQLLESMGFVEKNGVWYKILIRDVIDSNKLYEKYPIVKELYEEKLFDQVMKGDSDVLKNSMLYELERRLYPLKFADIEIPTYIIPIKPYWAGQLFDYHISNCCLFGADANKIWSRENVYYRNVKPVSEKFPARILWYSSSENGFIRQKSIIASSYLDEMSVDNVKIQFRNFKKYGIYEWGNVFQIAGKDISKPVKALRFSDTEVFEKEIPFTVVSEILIANNRKKNTFTSPLEINNKIFADIYSISLK